MKKTKLLTRAEKRAKKNYKGVPLTVSQKSIPYRGIVNLTNGSSSYGGNALGKANMNYLALVIQRTSGDWGYVRVNTHCLDVVNEPIVYEENDADYLIELWKRVVIDNVIPWEDHIYNDTLRIVKYVANIEDTTLDLLGDVDQANEIIRRFAVSKLTPMESRLLGLDVHKTKQIIMANSEFDSHDKNILQHLNDHSASMPLKAQLNLS